MIIAIWIFVLVLLGLWSLAAWGLYALLSLDHAWLGELKPMLEQVPFADWLERWVPGWQTLAELAVDAVQWALGALGGAAPVVVWAVWGAGTMLLVIIGAVLSLIVSLMTDKPASAAAAAASPPSLPPPAG